MSLIDRIEEYGHLQFDAGMDAASWAISSRRAKRTQKEAEELLIAIKAEIAALKPDWQPIETAPKDGTVILLRQVSVHHTTGELREDVVKAFWGPIPGPDYGNGWISTNQDGSYYCDSKFIHQETVGKDGNLSRYWLGCIHTHWAIPPTGTMEFPPLPVVEFGLVRYNL